MEGAPNEEDLLYRAFQAIYRSHMKNNGIETYEAAAKLAEKIRTKYPDYDDYRMYHVFAGSGLMPEKMPTKFDFPGEDSIADFIRSL